MNFISYAKRISRSGFHAMGFDVVRYRSAKSRERPTVSHQAAPPLMVHVLGAQGVGKSTICQEILRTSNNGVDLLYGYTRIEPPGRGWILGFDEMPSSFEKLLELKLKSISEDKRRTVHAKLRHLYFIYMLVTNHVWLTKLSFNRVKLVDSGLLQHFAPELLILHRADPGAFSKLVENSIIVHCVGDMDTILSRIDLRKKCGKVIPSHWGLDKNSLKDHIEIYRSERMHFVEAARQHGVPCLEVDAAENTRDNAWKAYEFIKSQRNSPQGERLKNSALGG
ncbi:hypothetical protein HOP52_00920 [Halomonas campisalis]|uniref:Uncharacterized protein n=1 Tax=Billgrantia campisalis TaxID=74661 RepID=A0ABS9P5G3_9GAMM|nr:hypothetical protein [Halomonas campisalis]MCG6656340.1 hypothetical protein [Halomonas campisalis]MDR5861525.1 hypothetical protein [Halomonas campisalis]